MYAKVFAQIYDGTLCTKGPWQALVTFQQLLVLADLEGNVDMTAGAIARRTTIPLEIIQIGLEELGKPDPDSRTPTAEGRRITPLSEGRSWGWRITNFKHYRDIRREEDRRAYHRDYWNSKRSKSAQNSTQVQQTQQTQHDSTNSTYKEAEEEAQTKEEEKKNTSPAPQATAQAPSDPPADPPKPKRQRQPAATVIKPLDVDEQTWVDWLALRKAKRAPVTQTVLDGARGEAGKASMPLEAFLRVWCRRGSQGLEASWLRPEERQAAGSHRETQYEAAARRRAEQFAPFSAVKAPGAAEQRGYIDVDAKRLD